LFVNHYGSSEIYTFTTEPRAAGIPGQGFDGARRPVTPAVFVIRSCFERLLSEKPK